MKIGKPLIGLFSTFSKLIRLVKVRYYNYRGASIGAGTYVSPKAYVDTHRPGHVTIGRNCYITRNVVILCHTDTRRGGPSGLWENRGEGRVYGDVYIGNNVFIGVNSVVLPGVRIGDNAIVGALTLVDKDIPGGSVSAGVPAKITGKTEDHIDSIRCSAHAER